MCTFNKQFINFNVSVDETVRYQCRNQDLTMVSDKEIFFIGDSYFFYLYNRNGKVSTFSLREISKAEYIARKDDIFRQRPNGRFGKFQKDGNEVFIACYKKVQWKKNMPLSDCILVATSPLKEVYDSVVAELETRDKLSKETVACSKKEYARMCGALGNRLGISYVNVLRIGVREEELRAFKTSYSEVIENVRKMSLTQLRELQLEIFKGSRTKRRKAMENLGIKFFNADVMLMDLSELEAVVCKPLEDYASESVKLAIENAADLSYEERLELYNSLVNANRNAKRQFLRRLGIEADAIDLKSYPLATIKHAIQATLGIDQY